MLSWLESEPGSLLPEDELAIDARHVEGGGLLMDGWTIGDGTLSIGGCGVEGSVGVAPMTVLLDPNSWRPAPDARV